jgi:hypothetical protein
MSLTIHGSHAGDVWIETDGELTCLSVLDLRIMRNQTRDTGSTTRAGITFDEADVTALIEALTGPQLDDCHHCEGPGLVPIEGRIVCLGHAAGFGLAEEESA